MLNTFKIGIILLATNLAFALLGPSAGAESKASVAEQDDDSVRNTLSGLETAIGSRKIESIVQLFTEDAQFIDQSGEEIHGRKALQERFTQRLNDGSAPSVGIHPNNITFPATNIALVVGDVSRRTGQEDWPASRFSMLLVRKDNNWLIRELQETTIQSAQTESRLQDLSWLIGKWTANKPDASAQLVFEWAPGRKFITSKCTVSKEGKQPQTDSQVIGWDPQQNTIVSWHFDSNGGFGNGIWKNQPDEKKWTVLTAGVGADGSNSTASNVFTLKSNDEFTWQSVQRYLDGATINDTEPITLQRIKH